MDFLRFWKLVFALSSLIFFGSNCSTKNLSNSGGTELFGVDTIRLEFDQTSLATEQFVSEVKFVHLNTNRLLVGKISKLIFTKSGFIVMDLSTNGIYHFTLDGDLVYHIKSPGNGPEEYVELKDFGVEEDLDILELMDIRGQKILQYRLSTGQFLKTISFGFFSYTFSPLKNGGRIFHNSVIPNGLYNGTDSLNASVYMTDAHNEVEKIFVDFKSTGLDKMRLVTFYNIFRNFSSEILYMPLYQDEVYAISQSSHLVPRFSIDFGPKSMPVDFLKSFNGDWREFPAKLYPTTYRHSVTDFMESKTHVTFNFVAGIQPFRVVYDKETGQSLTFSTTTSKDFGFQFNPKAVFEDYHVSVFAWEELSRLMNQLQVSSKPDRLQSSVLFKNLSSLGEQNHSENPILVMTKINKVEKEISN